MRFYARVVLDTHKAYDIFCHSVRDKSQFHPFFGIRFYSRVVGEAGSPDTMSAALNDTSA